MHYFCSLKGFENGVLNMVCPFVKKEGSCLQCINEKKNLIPTNYKRVAISEIVPKLFLWKRM